MSVHDWAFIAAGCVGVFVAIFHGLVTQKRMIAPILNETTLPGSIRRLVPLLLHFSTTCWLFGGFALIAMPFFLDVSAKLTTAVFVGVFYSIGAIGNLWGTRGKHPGWILLSVAVALIIFGVIPFI